MTLIEAHQILDEIKNGEKYPNYTIVKALVYTGDLQGRLRSKGVANEVSKESQRSWCTTGKSVVGRHHHEH